MARGRGSNRRVRPRTAHDRPARSSCSRHQPVCSSAHLLNLAANDLRDDLLNELLEVARRSLTLHHLEHLFADLANLRRLGVGRLLDLVRALLGEADRKQTQQVTVGGLDFALSLNQSLPLANQRTELVRSKVHTVEVGQAVFALNLIDAELDLAEGVLVVLVKVGKGQLEDAALERVVGVLQSGRTVDQGFAGVAGVEEGRCLDVVPV